MTYTVFLDRDGVFNHNPRLQVKSWKRFRWLSGVQDAFARLNRPDVQTCLVTNQPGTALGLSKREAIDGLHRSMQRELAASGGRLDHVEACYALPVLPNRRRKPDCGMLEDAAVHFEEQGSPVDKGKAVMIGDKVKDAQAAHNFGIPAIVLSTTMPTSALDPRLRAAGLSRWVIEPDLPAAIDRVLDWVEGSLPQVTARR